MMAAVREVCGSAAHARRWMRCKVCGKSQTAATGPRLGGALEQLGDKGGLGPHVSSANLLHLPLPHHSHRLVACQCTSRRAETAEAKPWSDQALHAPVVLFHDVIEKLALPQLRASPQLVVFLHL